MIPFLKKNKDGKKAAQVHGAPHGTGEHSVPADV